MLVCPECGGSEAGRTTCSADGAVFVDSGQDDLIGRTLGSYRVARLLGRGMGAVYLGVHPGIQSRVAIKVIASRTGPDSSDVQRFFAEARSVNLIQHENIINVLNLAYLPDGRPYIVMEYMEGDSLSAHLRAGMGARRLLGLTLEILDALQAAHRTGIVHRDLKPDNVMLTREGRVKLLDFGIAKLRVEGEPTQHLTATGAVLGTPAYMSPEQALARPTDARSDLYSLGIIVYQALAGQVPFRGDSLFEVLRQHVAEPPPPLAQLRPDLPRELVQLIERMLAKDPEARPRSANEVAAALGALLPGVPDTAPPNARAPGARLSAAPQSYASLSAPAHPSLAASTHWPVQAPHMPLQHPVQLAARRHPHGRPSGAPLQPRPSGASVQPFEAVPGRQGSGTVSTKWLALGATGMFLLIVGGAALAAALVLWLSRPTPEPALSATAATSPSPGPSVAAGTPAATGDTAVAAATLAPVAEGESTVAATQGANRSTAGSRPVSTGAQGAADPSRENSVSSPSRGAPHDPSTPPASSSKPSTAPLDPLSDVTLAPKTPRDVTINSFPDHANVVFNGRPLGKTPVVVPQILPGRYDVVLTLEGYETANYSFVVHNFLTEKRFDLRKKLIIPTR